MVQEVAGKHQRKDRCKINIYSAETCWVKKKYYGRMSNSEDAEVKLSATYEHKGKITSEQRIGKHSALKQGHINGRLSAEPCQSLLKISGFCNITMHLSKYRFFSSYLFFPPLQGLGIQQFWTHSSLNRFVFIPTLISSKNAYSSLSLDTLFHFIFWFNEISTYHRSSVHILFASVFRISQLPAFQSVS